MLGPLEVIGSDGRPVEVPGRRERAVLAALCAEPGTAVSADRLIDLVWGDALPDNPANALQARISVLRRVLGADRIRTTRSGYALVLDRDELDAWVLRDLVTEAGELAAGDPATAEARCTDALSRWRGEPLPELEDASLAPLITRWFELRRRAIELRASCLLELGRAGEAVVVATAGFEEDSLDEGMARVAMTALSRAGRQAEALRLGQRHRVAVAEAGLEVGPVIVATERALIDPAPTSPRLGRVPPPFYGNRCIGRDAELTIAEQAIAEHRLTTVVGPGGVGKTRLARELALHHPGWWCDLSVVPGDADLPAVVCSQLRIRPEQGASAEGAVVDALAHEAGLLVLDNCDELTQAAAELLRRLLSWCPAVNVLATSRQPLGVAGEKVVELTPLPVITSSTDRASPATGRWAPRRSARSASTTRSPRGLILTWRRIRRSTRRRRPSRSTRTMTAAGEPPSASSPG